MGKFWECAVREAMSEKQVCFGIKKKHIFEHAGEFLFLRVKRLFHKMEKGNTVL